LDIFQTAPRDRIGKNYAPGLGESREQTGLAPTELVRTPNCSEECTTLRARWDVLRADAPVTIAATDASENPTSQMRTITVDPAPAPPPSSAGGGGTHGTSPTFTVAPRVLNGGVRVGVSGPSARPMKPIRASHAGPNRIAFSGRLGKRCARGAAAPYSSRARCPYPPSGPACYSLATGIGVPDWTSLSATADDTARTA
jgi:hypothetical protein